MSELRELAAFAAGLRWSALPGEVRETAGLLLLDNLGAALGAVNNPQLRRVTEVYLSHAGGGGRVSLWGQHRRAPLTTAVFLNALQSDALGLDDLHTGAKTHIGAVVIPAAWGLAEELGADGKALLEAVVCGYEVTARIGMALGVARHRELGWHATATAGTFGAAAACGKLLGLDPERMVSALGLAGSQSFGVWAFLGDGTSSKSLNPARAAASGCEAALLAQAGMTGPEHILTAEDGGLLRTMSDGGQPALAAEGLGEVWQITRVDNRPYPCARSTHPAVDAALALREAYDLPPEEIAGVEIDTFRVAVKQCGSSQGSLSPQTPAQARFSLPYCVACALLYGEVSLACFGEDWLARPELRQLLPRIAVAEDGGFTEGYPRHWGSRVTVLCRDGRRLSSETADASGSVDRPLTRAQMKAKAVGLLRESHGDKAESLAEAILAVSEAAALPAL